VTGVSEEPRIRKGRRVEYRGHGVFHGKRGRVEDVWAGQALVYFTDSNNSTVAPIEYWELVNDL
jgi:hypothetical protein